MGLVYISSPPERQWWDMSLGEGCCYWGLAASREHLLCAWSRQSKVKEQRVPAVRDSAAQEQRQIGNTGDRCLESWG